MKYFIITALLLCFLGNCLMAQIPHNIISYSYDANGNRISRYYVQQSFKKGVNDTIVNFKDNITIKDSVNGKLTMATIKAFPNPTYQTIDVYLDGVCNGSEFKIAIYDIVGREKLKENNAKCGSNSFNIGSYPSGHYFITVSNSYQSKTFKILKY